MDFDELLRGISEVNTAIANGPIVPTVTPEEIRRHLDSLYDFSNPLALEAVVADVERMLQSWQVQVTHPRYMGLYNPSVTPASVVGDTLTAVYNPQLAAWRTSPAANEIERHTLAWLAAKFGLPAETIANFTSGGTEANLSAVIAALTRAFPAYPEQGLRSLPGSPVIYLTRQAHYGLNRTARVAGLGGEAVATVETDSDLKMDVSDLARKVAADRGKGKIPFMVVGNAGTTGAGVIDPLHDLARYCRAENLWFHVDAAYGGAAILSPRLRMHLQGIEAADSITCDAHKWFSVPMGAGMFFCRHPKVVRQAFGAEVTFMPGKTAGIATDPYTTSLQWSRRFTGLKLFLSLAHHGLPGYARMIEHQASMGELLRELLRRYGWRIVNTTPLPVVCFTRDALDTSMFLPKLYRQQIAWMSEVRLGDMAPCLRANISSFRTTQSDVQWVVAKLSELV
ncbi:MAG TPA: aminotransferase class V-fold PLP-dependent enzyme [Verrucomicrobiae bacterium]|nr:aminotransferase class V-fold PLP-dependent enzyme [Verrucomicrobiae bacterium]